MKHTDYLKHGTRILYKGNKLPCYLTFFITSKCNLRCAHCFYWKEINTVRNELTLSEIEKFSKFLGDLLFLALTGGEPTLRPDLAEIAEIFYNNNKVLNYLIPTNGFDTEKIVKSIDLVLHKVPSSVTVDISLDGFKDTHGKIRGAKNAFENAVRTTKELKVLKQKYSNLNIGISMTMTAQNQLELNDLYEFVKNEIKPDSVSLSLVRGDVKDKTSKNINIENFESLAGKISADSKGFSGFPFSSFTSAISSINRELVAKTIKEQAWFMPCYVESINAVVYPDGDVYFCELLDEKLGNLRDSDYDFGKIWYSPEANDIRRLINKQKCFCIHDCNMYTNILFSPKYFCKMLVRMIK